MDFALGPEQEDAAALARRLLTDRCTPSRLRQVEESPQRFDGDLWRELADAGLLGLHVPETVGGAGLGVLETCSVAVEVGRAVAPVPFAWHTVASGALARFGTPEQAQAWARPAVAGDLVATVALSEDHADVAHRPVTSARRSDGYWLVTGTKTAVPAGTIADLFLVPAASDEGVLVLLVAPGDPGVRLVGQRFNDGDSVARLDLDGVRLGDERVLAAPDVGNDAIAWMAASATVAVCAQQLGVLEGALDLTAGYARSREQFGRPIGAFQAVSQRLADAYIDLEGVRLTMWQAAWRLSEGLPAEVEVATAKLWAADAGHRVAHTTVHVHGGVGIDLEGAAHRYFTAAKRLELGLGGATRQGLAVGRALAAEPV